jgi:hypothetical protein
MAAPAALACAALAHATSPLPTEQVAVLNEQNRTVPFVVFGRTAGARPLPVRAREAVRVVTRIRATRVRLWIVDADGTRVSAPVSARPAAENGKVWRYRVPRQRRGDRLRGRISYERHGSKSHYAPLE